MTDPTPNYAVDPLLAQHTDGLIKEMKKRWRFDDYHNILTNLADEELIAALDDSINIINMIPPVTTLTWQTILFGPKIWMPIIYKAAARGAIQTLVSDWTGNYGDRRVEEYDIPSLLPQFQQLLGQIDAELERDVVETKKSLNYVSRRITTAETPTILGRYSTSRILRRYGTSSI